MSIPMTLYLARKNRKRCYVVAPNRRRAVELADKHLGAPSVRPSVTAIDDEVLVDVLAPADPAEAFGDLVERETAAAIEAQRKDDELMAAAARGEPFWGRKP